VQVKEMIASCDICNQVRSQQRKEPLVQQQVPSRAWAVVSTDLFELNKIMCLIVVDYFSNYFEYEALSAATSGLVIRAMKQLFARYGIPEKLISDNGTQFVSEEFKKFSRDYGFNHETSSPRYPQSNGKTERAVGVRKSMMEKSLIANSDFYVALLDFRNTPQADIGLSPSQRMFGRKTRSIIPAVQKQHEPQPLSDVQGKINRSRAKQKKLFDRGSRQLDELQVGDTVRMRLPGKKIWSKGAVVKQPSDRSYIVRVNGKSYRRNRRQLILTPELTDDNEQIEENEPLINGEHSQENINCPPEVEVDPQPERHDTSLSTSEEITQSILRVGEILHKLRTVY
jgi:hypothetical protein